MWSCQSGETGPWYEKASGPGARSALAGKRLPCNSQPVAGVRRPPHAWHEPIDAQAFAEAEAAFRKSCLALKITCCAPLRRVSVASIAACEPARPLALASHVCAGGTSAALPSAPPAPQGIRAELRVLRGSEPPRWLRAPRALCRRSRAPKTPVTRKAPVGKRDLLALQARRVRARARRSLLGHSALPPREGSLTPTLLASFHLQAARDPWLASREPGRACCANGPAATQDRDSGQSLNRQGASGLSVGPMGLLPPRVRAAARGPCGNVRLLRGSRGSCDREQQVRGARRLCIVSRSSWSRAAVLVGAACGHAGLGRPCSRGAFLLARLSRQGPRGTLSATPSSCLRVSRSRHALLLLAFSPSPSNPPTLPPKPARLAPLPPPAGFSRRRQ